MKSKNGKITISYDEVKSIAEVRFNSRLYNKYLYTGDYKDCIDILDTTIESIKARKMFLEGLIRGDEIKCGKK